MFLQETHSTKENEVEWLKDWEGNIFFSHKTSLSSGVAVLFSKHFLPMSCDCFEIMEGRVIKVIARFESIKMELINVYAPVKPIERMLFLEVLGENLKPCDVD